MGGLEVSSREREKGFEYSTLLPLAHLGEILNVGFCGKEWHSFWLKVKGTMSLENLSNTSYEKVLYKRIYATKVNVKCLYQKHV